jgi:hypothetical protein
METQIQFKTAKLAQEKGFKQRVIEIGFDYYKPDGEKLKLDEYSKEFIKFCVPYCTQSALAKWLREEHNIDVFLDSVGGKNGYFYVLQDVLTGNKIKAGYKYNIFENSFEEGLFEALNLISVS